MIVIDEKDGTDYISNRQTGVASGEASERPEIDEAELEDDLSGVTVLRRGILRLMLELWYDKLPELMQETPLFDNPFVMVASFEEVERRAVGRV